MPTPPSAKIIYGLAILLALVHQDFWYWSDTTLLSGFLPIGLAYHAVYSLAAAGGWVLAVLFAWPHHLEEWAAHGE